MINRIFGENLKKIHLIYFLVIALFGNFANFFDLSESIKARGLKLLSVDREHCLVKIL